MNETCKSGIKGRFLEFLLKSQAQWSRFSGQKGGLLVDSSVFYFKPKNGLGLDGFNSKVQVI